MQRAKRWRMQGTDFIVGDGCRVVKRDSVRQAIVVQKSSDGD